MKLKQLPADGYPKDRCAGHGCKNSSTLIDATGQLAEVDVPLCDDCFAQVPFPKAKKTVACAVPRTLMSRDQPSKEIDITVDLERFRIDDAPEPKLAAPESSKLFDW